MVSPPKCFTVFPREGEVTAYIFNRAGWWQKAQNWVSDVRDGRNRWGQNAIERINELGLQKGTIGISGLAGLFRAPEGIIPYSSVKAIQETLSASEDRQRHGDDAGDSRHQERRGSVDAGTLGGDHRENH